MPTQNLKVCNKCYRSFREARIKSFSKALTLIEISTVLKEINFNEAYQVFENLFMAKFTFFSSQKSSKNKSSKNWFDSKLQKLLDKKEELVRWYIQ